jgi:hypothetical protein
MKTLNFILWPILLFCLLWLGAIFFGPALVRNATSYFSEGRVELARVEVTPTLQINADVVDFVLPSMAGGKNLEVVSRALSIDWRVQGGFEIIGVIGPSSLKDRGTIGSANFTIRPTSVRDWSVVDIKLDFQNLAGGSFDVLRGAFSGKVTESFKTLKDVELVFPKVLGKVGNNPFQADALNVSVDRYTIGQSLTLQNLNTTLNTKQFVFPKGGLKASSIKVGLNISGGAADYKFLASGVHFDQYNLKAKSIALTSSHLLSESAFYGAGEFSVSDIVSKAPALNIENYSGNFKIAPAGISHNGKAIISALELKTDQYFIGQIENGILDVVVTSLVMPEKINLKGRVGLSLEGVDDFNASVSVESSLPEVDIFDCFEAKCGVEFLEAKYDIFVSDFALNGTLKCSEIDCLNRPITHVVQTDNTNEFFQALSEIGILSPLSLPIAYMAVSGGEVVGDGHVLNF